MGEGEKGEGPKVKASEFRPSNNKASYQRRGRARIHAAEDKIWEPQGPQQQGFAFSQNPGSAPAEWRWVPLCPNNEN